MAKSNQKEKIRDIIDEIKVAMMVTENDEGQLRSRPMYTSQYDEQGNIWFFTNEYSSKVDEVEQDRSINLAYAHPGKSDYLSISGRAYMVDNRPKKEELWNSTLKAWFPKGLESDRLTLLKVVPEEAEYWENSDNKLVRLFKIGAAALTHNDVSIGKHEKVQL